MKKALHLFNRGLVLGLEVCALLAVLVFLLWGALLVRLSMGPLDASFLTEKLEASMNARQKGYVFDVGSTQLVWGGHIDLFQIEMLDVHVKRDTGADVLYMRKVGVHLSKRHLVFGRLTPKLVRVYEPAMRVVRWENGHVSLNFDEEPAMLYGPPLPPEMKEAEAAAQVELIKSVLKELEGNTGIGLLLGGLEEVAVRDARLIYDDRILDLVVESEDTDIAVARTRSGILAKMSMAVSLSADRRMGIRAEGRHRWGEGESRFTLHVAGLDPSQFAARSEKLAAWRGVSVPLDAGVALWLDKDFKPRRARFIAGAKEGSFTGFGLYEDKPLPVKKFYAKGQYNADEQALRVDNLNIDLDGPRASGKVGIRKEELGYRLSAEAALLEMPMDELAHYWPAALAPDPRWWVTTHLSKGTAHKATIGLDMTYMPAPEEGINPIEINKLGGVIDFDGIKVDYFPPLMPVENVRGQAVYDQHAFNLAITGGTLGDMKVSKSAIAITNLADNDPATDVMIDIGVSLSGPVKTALKVLEPKPLAYPDMLGIKVDDVAGTADVDVSFKFPIHRGLDIADVKVSADATLRDVLMPKLVSGMDVSGGPMTLKVSNGALAVKGQGKLGQMPIVFDWQKSFEKSKDVDSSVTAELTLDDAARRAFGVPDSVPLKGNMPSKITYSAKKDGSATLDLKADLTPATLNIDEIGFSKASGTAGAAQMKINLKNGAPQRIENIVVETAGMVLRGDAELAAGGLRKASFPTAMWGQTQAAVDIENRGAGGYVLRVTGRQFDATRWMKDDGVPNNNSVAAVRSTPLQISMDVNRLVVGEDRAMDKVKMFLRRNEWQRIVQLEIDGLIGKDDIYLRYMPGSAGPSLRFEAANAGAALSLFGITKSIRGGKLVVKGDPTPQGGPRDMRGTVVLSDFTLRDAPVLALLLNSMSLVGVLDILNGQGIEFGRARVNFNWVDRGQPEQMENVRMIRLRDGRTSGASLGLNFEGTIDNWSNTLDLDGTIIPISGINNVLSGIPLVGDILTGGGSGILAATYTIKGPKDKPQVFVNPLSVLAPGILRKIFFEN